MDSLTSAWRHIVLPESLQHRHDNWINKHRQELAQQQQQQQQGQQQIYTQQQQQSSEQPSPHQHIDNDKYDHQQSSQKQTPQQQQPQQEQHSSSSSAGHLLSTPPPRQEPSSASPAAVLLHLDTGTQVAGKPSGSRSNVNGVTDHFVAISAHPLPPTAASGLETYAYLRERGLYHASLYLFVRLFSEFVGTALLVICHGGLSIINYEGALDLPGHAIGDGVTLVFLIYCMGEVGGAHYNPCVTLGMALRGMFPWAWVLFYWAAQLIGAIVGAAILRAVFTDLATHATNSVKPGWTQAGGMGVEALLTFILIFVILSICIRGKVVGANGALCVGATITLDVMWGDLISSASMNPFRTLGPAIVNGPTEYVWVFVAGPFMGMLLAVLAVEILSVGKVNQAAKDIAIGQGTEKEA